MKFKLIDGEKTMKLGKYIRYSTEKQDCEVQKEEIEKYIAKNLTNVELTVEYLDAGISGKNTDRPELQKLLDDIKNKKIDSVIFLKLDRLSRSLQDILSLFNTFESNNIQVIIVKEKIDTKTPMGKMFFHLLGMFAEFERSVIAQRLKEGKDYAKLHGTKSGLPMNRPRKHIDNMNECINLYGKGLSLTKLGKYYKMSPITVKKILIEHGVEIK